MTQFLGLNFQDLKLEHQSQLENFLRQYPQRLSGYTFAMLISWNSVFSYRWTHLGSQTLLISTYTRSDGQRHLIQPEGEFSEADQRWLLDAIRALKYPVKILAVTDEFLSKYSDFVAHFEVTEERGQDNYVYAAKDLADLAGRHYSKKRNLIAQAESLYTWTVQSLEAGCREECVSLLERIGNIAGEDVNEDLRDERQALHYMMTHFSQLNQRGVLIRIDDKPVAFAVYEPLFSDTAVIHFEKAERQYKGLYQLMNRETAKVIVKSGFRWINREEDLNLIGLRQAKMSYYPKELIRYNVMVLKNSDTPVMGGI